MEGRPEVRIGILGAARIAPMALIRPSRQVEAFVRLLRDGTPMATDAHDAIANMRVIDAIYQKAGLPLRPVTPVAQQE